MSLALSAATVGAGVLAAIPLGPVFLITYLVVAAVIYFVIALVLDLPLPGATRGAPDEDLPAPEYRGRGAPKAPPARGRPPHR